MTVSVPKVTEIGPEVAFRGTVVVRLNCVALVTIAGIPLNVTVLSDGVVLNPEPLIDTVAPTAPLSGLKSLIPNVSPVSLNTNGP